MLFYAFLVVGYSGKSAAELKEWAQHVLKERTCALEQGAAWKPPAGGETGWRRINGTISSLFEPLEVARQGRSAGEMEKIGWAIQGWNNEGAFDGLHEDFGKQLSKTTSLRQEAEGRVEGQEDAGRGRRVGGPGRLYAWRSSSPSVARSCAAL